MIYDLLLIEQIDVNNSVTTQDHLKLTSEQKWWLVSKKNKNIFTYIFKT